MDNVALDRLLAELRHDLVGRSLDRPRLLGAASIAFEIAGARGRWLVLEAKRGRPGLCVVAKGDLLEPVEPVSGAARQALLLFRKHAAGPRLREIFRIEGERFVMFSLGQVLMTLRLGPKPAISLVVSERLLATLGEAPAWPVPRPHGEGEAAPDLRPFVIAPHSLDDLVYADLASDAAIRLDAFATTKTGEVATPAPSWKAAAATVFRLRVRGERFRTLRRRVAVSVARERRRKETLRQRLTADLTRMAGADELRRAAEALLSAPNVRPGADGSADVADPYDPSRSLRVMVDPRLGPRGSADRLFERARRLEKARPVLEKRLRRVEQELVQLTERGLRIEEARHIEDLPGEPAAKAATDRHAGRSGPRRYLTSRGLTLWVGRGARENQELTFRKAKPDDHWFHVRDRPGAHVILMDNEGRATAEDLREAAEVAAFFSEAAGEAAADVHATRRKHLRPVKGSPGRVVIGFSETLRVTPKDPEGRLRRR